MNVILIDHSYDTFWIGACQSAAWNLKRGFGVFQKMTLLMVLCFCSFFECLRLCESAECNKPTTTEDIPIPDTPCAPAAGRSNTLLQSLLE